MAILASPSIVKNLAVIIWITACLVSLMFIKVKAFSEEASKDHTNPTDRIISNIQHNKHKYYLDLASQEAKKNHLPADIADAVIAIESGYDPNAVGTVGEIGLMQVRPETATMLGFNGQIEDLAKPEINIHYGVRYLSDAWRLANGDLCRALMKYRAGHGEENMTALSADYCNRARAHLAAIGSRFASGAMPLVTEPVGSNRFFPPNIPQKRGPQIRTFLTSRAFWKAEERRIKAITARIERKWHRLAAR